MRALFGGLFANMFVIALDVRCERPVVLELPGAQGTFQRSQVFVSLSCFGRCFCQRFLSSRFLIARLVKSDNRCLGALEERLAHAFDVDVGVRRWRRDSVRAFHVRQAELK